MYTTNNIVNELFFFNSEEFEAHISELYSNVDECDLYDLGSMDIEWEIDRSWEVQLYEEMMAEIDYENRMLAQEFI